MDFKKCLIEFRTGLLNLAIYLQHQENLLVLQHSSFSCSLCLFLRKTLLGADQDTTPEFIKDDPIVLTTESGPVTARTTPFPFQVPNSTGSSYNAGFILKSSKLSRGRKARCCGEQIPCQS